MKPQYYRNTTTVVILTLLLNGCMPIFPATHQIPITSTDRPKITTPPITTLQPTNLPTPTLQLPLDALPPSEAYIRLYDLIVGNGNCTFPCWWGIVPGTANLQEISEILEPLLSISNKTSLNPRNITFQNHSLKTSGMTLKYPTDDEFISYGIGWFQNVDRETIDQIYIWTKVTEEISENDSIAYRDDYDSQVYSQLMERYQVGNILRTYGIPSQILIFGEVYDPVINAGFTDMFYVWLLYPNQGIFVGYEYMLVEPGNQNWGTICLNKSFITLWVFLPEESDYYGALAAYQEGLPPYHSEYLPIGDAVGITTEDFYQTYKDSRSPCIEVPLSIWPAH
jgi:hypothetical protein